MEVPPSNGNFRAGTKPRNETGKGSSRFKIGKGSLIHSRIQDVSQEDELGSSEAHSSFQAGTSSVLLGMFFLLGYTTHVWCKL